jgi:hypothetical protein
MLWSSCIGPPSQPKLALSLPIKGPFFCRLTVFGGSAAGGSENHTTAPLARGNAPLLPPVAASPPEGEILAAPRFEMLMRQAAERRANFPLRGKWCAAPKGVHFLGRSPVVWFSFRYCHKLKLARCPAPIVPSAKLGERWWRQPPKGVLPKATFYTGARRAPTSPAQRFYITPL